MDKFSSMLRIKEHDRLSKKSFHRNVGAKNIKAIKYWMGVGLKQIELKKKLFLKTLQTRKIITFSKKIIVRTEVKNS